MTVTLAHGHLAPSVQPAEHHRSDQMERSIPRGSRSHLAPSASVNSTATSHFGSLPLASSCSRKQGAI